MKVQHDCIFGLFLCFAEQTPIKTGRRSRGEKSTNSFSPPLVIISQTTTNFASVLCVQVDTDFGLILCLMTCRDRLLATRLYKTRRAGHHPVRFLYQRILAMLCTLGWKETRQHHALLGIWRQGRLRPRIRHLWAHLHVRL